jgi:flagellar biosynthesis/type III secretory pathway chaperone
METASIETLFHEKLMLYRELVETLKEEKERIIHADVDALWRVSEKKQAIAGHIEDVRGRILDALTELGISHDMNGLNYQASRVMSLLPLEQKKQLTGAHFSLVALKEEINSISRDNKHYIESYLSMLDDLITILTGRENLSPTYSNNRKAADAGSRIFYREV